MKLKGLMNLKVMKKKNIIILLFLILGIIFLKSFFTVREGINPDEAGALVKDIKSTINEKMSEAGVPYDMPDTSDLFNSLTNIMEVEVARETQRASANAAATQNTTPAQNTVVPIIIDNSFFKGNKISDAFCDKYRGTSQLGEKCESLTEDNCNLTDCCVYVNGSKCMAGSAAGPTNMPGVTKDSDYYFYKYQCHGNCISDSSCSKYADGDKNVSNECFSELWKDVGCTMQIPNTDSWKLQTKSNVYDDMVLQASMPDANHRKMCYGEIKNQWPNLNNNYKRVFKNNGSVSCSRYCSGTGGNSWNNELPANWRGAVCAAAGFNDDKDCDSISGASAQGTQCICARSDNTPWSSYS